MNREILFKAKRFDNGEWVEGYYFYAGSKYMILNFTEKNSELYHNMYEVQANTICQYTGLTDKDGNKIWENDIVAVPGDEDPCLIVWDENCARWGMTQCGSYMYDFDNFDGVELEVLGNIFDTPELLEGGAEE